MNRESIKALFVFIAVMLFLVFISCLANGQSTADVRIKTIETDGGRGHGSGVVILGNDSGSVVLTVAHNINQAQSIAVMGIDGATQPANVMSKDVERDLAILWTSLRTKHYRPIATSFNPQQSFYVTGWPHTGQRYRCHVANTVGRYQSGYIFSGRVYQGQSGGAITDGSGNVVGVVMGCDQVNCFAPSGDGVFRFVKQTIHDRIETQCIGGSCGRPPVYQRQPLRENPMLVETNPKPRQPPAITQPPQSAYPKPDSRCDDIHKQVQKSCDEIRASLEEMKRDRQTLIDSIENHSHQTQPTIPGPTGQRGPQGPKGDPGPPGKDATVDIDAIVARVIAEMPDATPQPQTEIMHYVLVADENASYWGRIGDRLRRAQEQYSQIRQTPIPDFPIGAVPQLVAYEDGKPLGAFKGARDVENALSLISRGEIPKP